MYSNPSYQDNGRLCLLCEEAITNPICFACIRKGIINWLKENNPDLINSFDDISKSLEDYTDMGEKTTCILCRRKMQICSHCYTKEIFEWLKKEKPSFVEEFLDMFNFELKTLYGYLVR